jgi:hypothetical protein
LTDTTANRDDAYLKFAGSQARAKIKLNLTIHRYLPVAAFYFFLNSVGLPRGLFFTTVFAPLLFLWLYLKRQHWLTTKFLLILSPFILAHLSIGIGSYVYYLRSLLLLWTVFIAVYALCWGLLNTRNIDRLFDELIALNFGLTLLALACRYTPVRDLFWMDRSDTLAGTSHLLRLSMFTSEPSAYAELMLPLIIFTALRLLANRGKRNALYFAMISFPFLLTQSFGGLSISFAALGVTLMTSYRRLLKRPRSLIIVAFLLSAFAALLFIPNPLGARVFQVLSGNDSSTQSRTTMSFFVAYTVAASKSIWWGVGLGQGKIIDVSDLGVGFDVGIIPNAVAGTFAELGIVGVIARLTVEVVLFFKSKVYLNSFSLAMFVAAFIVQFTGSHLMDVQQYLMWCFAFFPLLPGFEMRSAGSQEGRIAPGTEPLHAG